MISSAGLRLGRSPAGMMAVAVPVALPVTFDDVGLFMR
jgi:hypothetical protein